MEDNEKRRWIEFLKANNILWEIRVQKNVGDTGYVTGINTDYEIPYLKQYLELRNVPLARYIWRSLCSEGGWSYSYATKYYKLNRNYNGRSEISTVLSLLKRTRWVPDRTGVFRLPRDVSRDTIDSSFIIDESNGFLAAIEFGANAKKREEEERARREKEFLEQAQQVEAAKRLGFDSTEAVIASKEDSKKIKKLKELGFDIDELISAAEKKRKDKQRKDIGTMLSDRKDEKFTEAHTSDYDPAATVKDPARSKKKAEEDLGEEPEDQKKKVTVRKDTKPNKEEKQFLYNQYSGKCQVCSKRIIKKDGSYYFEAINLMDTSVLEDKYQTGLGLGWNSLCMCPNCAAEYQHGAVSLYDFKDKVQGLTIDKSVDDYIEFPIRMQGEERILRYSPVHLFNLQTAIDHFSRVASGETDIGEKIMPAKNLQSPSATLIKRLESGDQCPDCGTRNNNSSTLTVTDRNGNTRKITAILCQCGTRYLTRKLYGKIADPSVFNIVSAGLSPSSTTKGPKKSEPGIKPRSVSKTSRKSIVINKRELEKCKRCGTPGTVLGSGLCWNCYKEERQSMYE